jgi:transglutaminase-like putative cysteine protease
MTLATNLHADEKRSAVEEQNLFLFQIPVTVEPGALDKENPTLLISIPSFKGDDFGEISARFKKVVVDGETIEITSSKYPQSADKIKREHRAASFIVDYNEPVFAKIAKEITKRFGSKPTPKQLTEYVHDFIEKKSYRRGFDVASKVLATQEGDCSEHAVLLVALLRRFKIPARLVFGIVIIDRPGGDAFCVGHAWVEYQQAHKWHFADAALWLNSDEKSKDFRILSYIPVRVLTNEGPGFLSALLSGFYIMHIQSVAIR